MNTNYIIFRNEKMRNSNFYLFMGVSKEQKIVEGNV